LSTIGSTVMRSATEKPPKKIGGILGLPGWTMLEPAGNEK